jgi:hypothetical protein
MTSTDDCRIAVRPGKFVRIISGPDKGRRARVTLVTEGAVAAEIVALGGSSYGTGRRVVLKWDEIRPTGRARPPCNGTKPGG